MYLKEGLCQQYALMDQLSKLLLFESSLQVEGKLVTLDEYISRCPPEQKQVCTIERGRELCINIILYHTHCTLSHVSESCFK